MNKTLIFTVAAIVSFTITPRPLPAASPPTPEMFAYGMVLEAPEGNAFYEFDLPLDVYKAATGTDLHDIRIFNATGTVVPHVLYQPELRSQRQHAIEEQLPFFPVMAPASSSADEITVHVEKNAQGSIVDVKAGNGDSRSFVDQKIVSYLIDCSSLKGKAVSALELEWSDNQADFMGSVIVEASSDLNRWQKIATGTIARLGYGTYRLDRKKIPLSGTGKAYLRLSWPHSQEALSLTGVRALAESTQTVNRPGYRWTLVTATPLSGKPGQYTIDTGGFLPADRINIRLQDKNSMAAVKLFSGPSAEKNNTSEQWRGLLYNLEYQGAAIHNSAINVRGSASRFWLLTYDESETAPNNPPLLEFGWQPHRLIFLAQGTGPFQIAYGSGAVSRPDFKVDPLLRKYQQGSGMIKPDLITPGPQYVLAGSERLKSPRSLPWKKYILWASLFAGVLAIGWMSVTLFRQLQAGDQKGQSDDGEEA
ncbi:MAG: DUF3999 domain-containing protein [Proteobacteria bacterium]|nr:DUF3999 domain-containing protein [Pseudomonadota bacterium]MBU1736811.1 DUF3999 domain-containing protein [Pseudomonadota bacterium]